MNLVENIAERTNEESKFTTITIKEVIQSIDFRKYCLPSIQREFVWDSSQIEALFDSLMRDYPIGSFLYWNVNQVTTQEYHQEYQFYEFIGEFDENEPYNIKKFSLSGNSGITAIIDGQQRFTALYIGLKGTYTSKKNGKGRISLKDWKNPQKELYLNIFKPAKNDNNNRNEYEFKFLSKSESKNDEGHFWFKVGNIYNQNEDFIGNFLNNNDLLGTKLSELKFPPVTLYKLLEVINNKQVINYYKEQEQDLNKILEIFIRANSGGEPLSYPDLLLSTATALWNEKDARYEINKLIKDINIYKKKRIKDFILKSCLALTELDLVFKIKNFNKTNMKKIEDNWDNISLSLKLATKLVSENFGYRDGKTFISINILIPIAYYLLKKGNPENFIGSTNAYKRDRENILKWLNRAILKSVFGRGAGDNTLKKILKVIKEDHSMFPTSQIIEAFEGENVSFIFSEDASIEKLFTTFGYKDIDTFSALSLLYPDLDYRNKFHIDHIYPKSRFKNKPIIDRNGARPDEIDFYSENYNLMANLQLLEGEENQKKQDMQFETWLFEKYPEEEDRKKYMEKNYIPQNIDLSYGNFKQFIEERKKLMTQKLKQISD